MTARARAAIALALALYGCVNREAAAPGVLVIGMEAGPRSLDPRMYTDAAASKAGGLLFNGLLARDDNGALVPDLAESLESPSPARYLFRLRGGVKFHDGRALTSRDVKATIEWILDPANASPRRSAFETLASIETPDELTAVFNLSEPTSPFLDELTQPIVPAGAGPEMAERPVGAGPFAFVENRHEERLVLRANHDYFEGAPQLRGVIFKIIPDETVRALELERGGVHLLMNPITPDLLPRYRANPCLRVVTRQGTNYSYLGFNLGDPLTGDLAVRRAIAHALDRRNVITHILKGLATPASGMLTPVNEYYEPDVAAYPYDPARARAILDAAGYRDPDGGGPLPRFTLRYATSQNEIRKRIAEVFQWQLAQAGIGLDIRSYEWGAFYDSIRKGAFQMFSLTWVGLYDPDIYRHVFHSASTPPQGANRGRFRDARIDLLTELGRRVTGEERRRAYSEVQKIVAERLPYVSLWHGVNVAVMRANVNGFALAPDENLASLRRVWIGPEK